VVSGLKRSPRLLPFFVGRSLNAQIGASAGQGKLILAVQFNRDIGGVVCMSGQKLPAFIPHDPALRADHVLVLETQLVALAVPLAFRAFSVWILPADAVVFEVLLGAVKPAFLREVEGFALGQAAKCLRRHAVLGMCGQGQHGYEGEAFQLMCCPQESGASDIWVICWMFVVSWPLSICTIKMVSPFLIWRKQAARVSPQSKQ